MVLQYDGTKYNGWQKQGNTENTIQGKLEQLLSKLTGEEIEVHGAGRTDAGVHANGQVMNFHTDTLKLSPEEIKNQVNMYLPEDIAVLEVKDKDARFHSRLNAKEKTYCYKIAIGVKADVFERKYCLLHKDALDVAKMRKAADYLIGEHDFAGFCDRKPGKKSTVRKIKKVSIIENNDGRKLEIRITGNGFLYHMVRLITAMLLEVGEGKKEPESIKKVLEVKDRAVAGGLAPAKGLVLENIVY